ncbi:MAG: glycosyltransferase family 2 protein [Rhodothermales bacterium]
MNEKRYVLVTPAKNEADFIEKTLASVVKQTIKPVKWVVVSDGSTDRTDEIVRQYAEEHDFVTLVRRDSATRHFGNKVHAFRAGYAALGDIAYDFVGNLDADIELPPDYYERILDKFIQDPKLGLAGGTRFDFCDGAFVKVHCARNSVGGPFQLFRRSCYEAFGGYIPLELGGIDAVAEIMVRQHGWRVSSFTDIIAHHYRCTGTAKGNIYQAAYRGGKKLYVIGYHPLFELVKLMRVRSVKGAIANLYELAGYTKAALFRFKRQVPDEFVQYLRKEQVGRLKHMFMLRKDPAMVVDATN